MGSGLPEASARAKRFPLQIPLRYRLPHTPDWVEARTENVSRTGVLFQSERVFKPTTMVDVRLEIPPTNGNGAHAEVVCKCEVVRVEQPRESRISPALAVAIHRYRFTRKWQPNASR